MTLPQQTIEPFLFVLLSQPAVEIIDVETRPVHRIPVKEFTKKDLEIVGIGCTEELTIPISIGRQSKGR